MSATQTTEISRDTQRARALLERGLVVAIPTETVYGLAANALDPTAVTQIFEIKNRPYFDPLIVHGDSRDKLRPYVRNFPKWAEALSKNFWPGPLTLVLEKADEIPDIVTSGHLTVGIRVPAHPVTLELLSGLEFPLAAPSANPFGYVSPTTPEHVLAQLGGKLPMILDGGICSVGLESTIVGEMDGKLTVLRVGGLSVEEIETVVGKVEVNISSTSNPANPGSLEVHYAPRTPIRFGQIDPGKFDLLRIGILSFTSRYPEIPIEHQFTLSPEGDLREAARHLFATMRHLDTLGLDVILAEEFPNVGLGRAINDRLRRASAKSIHG